MSIYVQYYVDTYCINLYSESDLYVTLIRIVVKYMKRVVPLFPLLCYTNAGSGIYWLPGSLSWWRCTMGDSKEDEEMITENKSIQQTKVMKDADILKIAKQGANKYRKTLDRLAKN